MDKNNKKTMVRVRKHDNPYVQIDKTCLNDIQLSWKAKGLLCYLLSLPDDWQIYVSELKNHAADGRDSTANAIKELMNRGYCKRTVCRDDMGHIKGYIYNIFEVPEGGYKTEPNNIQNSPKTDFPYSGLPFSGLPFSDKPYTENPELLKNNITKEINTLKNDLTNQSIYPSPKENLMEMNDRIEEHNNYRKIIAENIEYEHLKTYQYKYDTIIDDILEVLVDTVTSTKPTIRVAGEEKPSEIVKSTLLKLNSGHIEYVINCLKNSTTKIRGTVDGYLLTCLYKAPKTMNAYYENLVHHDMAYNAL